MYAKKSVDYGKNKFILITDCFIYQTIGWLVIHAYCGVHFGKKEGFQTEDASRLWRASIFTVRFVLEPAFRV